MTDLLSTRIAQKDLTKWVKKIINRDTSLNFPKMNNLSRIGTGLAAMLAATNANAEDAAKLETPEAAQAAVAVDTVTRAECLAMEIKNDKIACLIKLRDQKDAEIAAKTEIRDSETARADAEAASNEEKRTTNRGLRRVIAMQEAPEREQE